IFYAVKLASREFVPRQEDRRIVTWTNFPQVFSYCIPYFFMAYLVRRRDTRLLRILLLPLVVAMAVRCTWGYTFANPRLRWYEWDRGIIALVCIAKAIDFAWAKNGRHKMTEQSLKVVNDQQGPIRSNNANRTGLLAHFPDGLCDALEVGLSMRGIGWDFGQYIYVPPPTQPLSRRPFVVHALKNLVHNVLAIDLIDTIIKLTPGVGPTSGTIFLAHLSPFPRYALSTVLHLGFGLLIHCGVCVVYDSFALLAVLGIGQSPAGWPPITGGLWHVTSLHAFWSRAWHQALRHVFLVYGGFPGRAVAGRAGATVGTFLASGLVHELGITAAGVGFDARVLVFFLLQAVGVVLEKTLREVMGRRVGGFFGFMWAALFVVGFGQMCTDAWFSRGIGGATTIPTQLSPIRRLVLPSSRWLVYVALKGAECSK
ncbi:uncharacterized protein BXZ73DRAFT_37838, partial [Epithele typhae]|uniref:uncharacterized protein n=1 Tax=Epithele typhae TaxID=378194 RepID=UPI00200757DF